MENTRLHAHRIRNREDYRSRHHYKDCTRKDLITEIALAELLYVELCTIISRVINTDFHCKQSRIRFQALLHDHNLNDTEMLCCCWTLPSIPLKIDTEAAGEHGGCGGRDQPGQRFTYPLISICMYILKTLSAQFLAGWHKDRQDPKEEKCLDLRFSLCSNPKSFMSSCFLHQ